MKFYQNCWFKANLIWRLTPVFQFLTPVFQFLLQYFLNFLIMLWFRNNLVNRWFYRAFILTNIRPDWVNLKVNYSTQMRNVIVFYYFWGFIKFICHLLHHERTISLNYIIYTLLVIRKKHSRKNRLLCEQTYNSYINKKQLVN